MHKNIHYLYFFRISGDPAVTFSAGHIWMPRGRDLELQKSLGREQLEGFRTVPQPWRWHLSDFQHFQAWENRASSLKYRKVKGFDHDKDVLNNKKHLD